MNPKTGLYEQLIDVVLDGRLRELPGSAYEIQREKVDEAEAHAVLSRYMQKVIRNALRSLPARNRLENQIALVNRIIALIGEITGDAALDGAALPADTEMLLAILARLNLPPTARAGDRVPRPLTRLSQSSLFTGSRTEPSLASELKKEILSADRIDILMSFIKWSGLRIIADELKEFTDRPASRLRVITTTYIGATDIRARLIHDAIRKYLQDLDQVIGLGFCVGVRHAEYMATVFFSAIILPISLTSSLNCGLFTRRLSVNT